MVYVAARLMSPDNAADDFDRMSRELFWQVEQTLITHKLAKEYFGFRALWMQTLPLLSITTFITVIGFIQYGHYGGFAEGLVTRADYNSAKKGLAISVGILGLISSMLTSLIMNMRYQQQQGMHALAEETLSKVCHSIRFPDRSPLDDRRKLMEHLARQKAIYSSISFASASVPPRIVYAFHDLEHIMMSKPYTFRALQYERFYYFLWKLFTRRSFWKFNLWPCWICDINVPEGSLGELIEEEYNKYTAGLEEAAKRGSFAQRRRSTSDRHSQEGIILENEERDFATSAGSLDHTTVISTVTPAEV
jgi:hypothetical protein